MSRISKIIITLIILSLLIAVYVFYHTEKIMLEKEKVVEGVANNISTSSDSMVVTKKDKLYLEEIGKVIAGCDTFLLKLNNEYDDMNIRKSNFGAKKETDEIMLKLNAITVPSKYKELHLLFSRSLLKLSSYFETYKQNEKKEGLDLYRDAKKQFELLNEEQKPI